MAKLGEVCDILNGYAFKSNQYTTSGVRIIRISNVQKGYIEDKSPVYYPCDDENVKKYELKQNDLLISLTGNVGRTALLEEKFLPAALNQRVSCVRLKEPDKVLKTYLFHLLNSDYFEQQCMKAAEGVAQKNLSPKWLFEYKIPIYSIERQKEISNTLDKIDLLIILRKQQLAKLDELVKARFVEMFGKLHKTEYNIKTLDELCEFIKDGTHQTPTYVDVTEGYKFLSSKDVTSGYIDWSSIKYISEELHQELYKRIAPQRGDILLAKNGTTGIPAIVETDETFDIYVSLALLRLKPNNNVRYIWSALRMPETKAQFDKSLKGVGVPNLHLGEIKKTKIIVPPFSLQNQFATFVEHVDKQKQTMQQSLEKLELMKKALMQEYFG